jgi:hypothetical protein
LNQHKTHNLAIRLGVVLTDLCCRLLNDLVSVRSLGPPLVFVQLTIATCVQEEQPQQAVVAEDNLDDLLGAP